MSKNQTILILKKFKKDLLLHLRWRSTAIGICLCGAGVGTFLLAPLESYLTGNYQPKSY